MGHHLASSVQLHDEVATRDDRTREVAADAVAVLRRAASRIDARDPAGASALLGRAATVTDDLAETAALHARRFALLRNTMDIVSGIAAWRLAHEAALRSGDARGQLLVRIMGSTLARQLPHLGLSGLSDEELDVARQRFTEDGDDEGLCAALNALVDRGSEVSLWAGNLELLDQLAALAARTGDTATLVSARMGVLGPCVWGPLPASEALRRTDGLLADPLLQASELLIGIHGARAAALAMLDRPYDAREAIARASTLAAELHIPMLNRTMGFGYTRWLLRDLDEAAELFQFGLDMLGPQGEVGWVSTLLPMLGYVRLARGDVTEARRCAEQARVICPPRDIESNARWRGLLALVESRSGNDEEAVRLAAEAVEWELRGDQLDSIGDRFQDQAEVLLAAGRRHEAVESLDRAVEYFRRKENLASVRRANELRATF